MPTNFLVQRFSDRHLVFISQRGNIGSLTAVDAESKTGDGSSATYAGAGRSR